VRHAASLAKKESGGLFGSDLLRSRAWCTVHSAPDQLRY